MVLQAGDVALDPKVEARDLLAIGSEDEDVGFAHLLAEQIDAARGAGDGVGDGRVGDQNVVGILRQVDDERLVEAELDALGRGLRPDPGRCLRLARRQRRHGHAEPRYGEHRCQRSGNAAGRRLILPLDHLPAPTSLTSPDLIMRTVPRRPCPDTR